MDKTQEAVKVFGFDPAIVGLRHRGWWIISEPDDDDLQVGAKSGDLCVKARDGASNPIDVSAFKVGDCIGSRYRAEVSDILAIESEGKDADQGQ